MLRRRPHRPLLAVAACFAATVCYAQDKLPTQVFLDMVDGQMARQCEAARAQTRTAVNDYEKGAARAGIMLGCDCMPRELKDLGARKDLPVEVTQEEALALLKPHFDRCAAQSLRQVLVSDCPTSGMKEPGVTDVKAFCACLSAGVARLSDAEIVGGALAAHDDFEERAAVARDEESRPAKRSGSLETLGNTCRAEQGAPPNP